MAGPVPEIIDVLIVVYVCKLPSLVRSLKKRLYACPLHEMSERGLFTPPGIKEAISFEAGLGNFQSLLP